MNKSKEHIQDFLNAVRLAEIEYGIQITVEQSDGTLRLVNLEEDHRALAFTNTEVLPDSIEDLEIVPEEVERLLKNRGLNEQEEV